MPWVLLLKVLRSEVQWVLQTVLDAVGALVGAAVGALCFWFDWSYSCGELPVGTIQYTATNEKQSTYIVVISMS
jgi:hypothetical protein